jgi:hypothetical protein
MCCLHARVLRIVGIEMQSLELFRELATARGVASATPTSSFERFTY